MKSDSLINQALNNLLNGDEESCKEKLREFVNLTIGFEKLSVLTGIPSKSLHRMLANRGNPTIANLAILLKVLNNI